MEGNMIDQMIKLIEVRLKEKRIVNLIFIKIDHIQRFVIKGFEQIGFSKRRIGTINQ
jgi:hypothetical protein